MIELSKQGLELEQKWILFEDFIDIKNIVEEGR